MEKVFDKFQRLSRFPRRMVLYFSSKFCIFEPFTNIQSHRKFSSGFCQTSGQVYRKFQHEEKILAKFQGQPHFPRKMVLYFLAKFGIKKIGTNIPWLRRFDLGFLQSSKLIFRKLQYTKKEDLVPGKFQSLLRFPRKWLCIRWPNFAFLILLSTLYPTEDLI